MSSLSATMKEISCLDLVNALFALFLGSFRRNKQVSLYKLPPRHIPFEIIIEILSWLPVESLQRFKCVCKQWFLLIEDQDDKTFIAKQSVWGSHSMLNYFQTSQECGGSLKAISDESFKLVGSHSGLCLEARVDSCHVARVRNPATRRVVYLPDAHKDTYRLLIAVDSSTGECKVVCTYSIKTDYDDEDFATGGVGFQVLTVGKDEQWRPLKHPNQEERSQGIPLEHVESEVEARQCIFACQSGGVVHLSEVIFLDEPYYIKLYHLDIFSESFTTTILTEGDFPNVLFVCYFIWGERLAVGEFRRGMLSILVLEDSKQPKWSESKIIISLKSIYQADPHMLLCNVLDFSLGNEITFETTDKRCLRYDMKRESNQFAEWSQIGEESLAAMKSSLLNIKEMKPE